MNSCASSTFSTPRSSLCSWFLTCYCTYLDITIYFPLSIMPFITVMSDLNVQCGIISCSISFLLSGQPLMMCFLSCCGRSSLTVVSCIYCIVMQFGMSFAVSMPLMFIFILGISSSLFSLWFYLDSQSALNRSGAYLYNILTLYW